MLNLSGTGIHLLDVYHQHQEQEDISNGFGSFLPLRLQSTLLQWLCFTRRCQEVVYQVLED
jgi:hypothetical protein